MICKITRPVQGGTIKAIPSKSAAHRLMIAAGLSGLELEGIGDGLSVDITATKECIYALRSEEAVKELPCQESGSTLRFLIPVAAALGADTRFLAKGRLPYRPMTALKEQMESHGCTMSEEGENPIWIRGQLQPGVYELPGNISSQYVTGLLFALPLLDGDSEIHVDGILQSRPYVDMTLDVLRKAEIEIEEKENSFLVKGNQKYSMKEIPEFEGDWSNGAFWIVMDAIMDGAINCTGLDPESAQGDKEIANIVTKLSGTEEVDIDVADIPDLVPIVSVLATARKKGVVTNIVNAERLRYKESDRLKVVTEVMNGLGAKIEEFQDSLRIHGTERIRGGEADSNNDHRIAMMAAAAACIADEPITIMDAEAVNKSYPGFYEHYESLGGKVEWI